MAMNTLELSDDECKALRDALITRDSFLAQVINHGRDVDDFFKGEMGKVWKLIDKIDNVQERTIGETQNGNESQ